MPTLTEYEIHPAAELFPMMDAKSFAELKDDIDAHGVKECITLFEGRIIDGRNRYKAMRELGIDPACHAAELEECDDPIGYVLSLNLHRRHLTETQRALVAAKIAKLKLGDNQHTKEGPSIGGPSTSEAAEMLSVGTRSVERAKHAIDKGASAVVKAMESGELPASVAAKFVDVVPDKKEQTRIVSQGAKAVKEAVKERTEAAPASERVRIINIEPEPPPPERKPVSYFARFRALWDEADVTGRAAIVAFVMDYSGKK